MLPDSCHGPVVGPAAGAPVMALPHPQHKALLGTQFCRELRARSGRQGVSTSNSYDLLSPWQGRCSPGPSPEPPHWHAEQITILFSQ